MCRLYAQVSAGPETARDLLVESEFSLLRQADADPSNPQTDGWGLAWFGPDGRARVEKSGGPAPKERPRLAAAADRALSPVVVGHIRAASRGIAVDDAHAHPFEDEGWVFAHNGTLTIWREVAEALGPRRARMRTQSDSEAYFQQFLKHLASVKDPSRAFEECILEDWRLWEECRVRYPQAATPYTSLNAIASDGRGIHAVCHASRGGLGKHGVCHADQPWSVMSFSTRGGRFILASEGLDGGDWTRLSPPETVSAVLAGGRVDVRRRPLSLRSSFGPIPEASRT